MIYGRRQQVFTDYEGFVEKYKPKKTTDDCITPLAVYNEVLSWAVKEYGLEGRPVVRPFWADGDYEMFDYPENCVVIDNPPFSIISKIAYYYTDKKVDYFLFAPHLTLFNIKAANHIAAGVDIKYENGAVVKTSFITNMGEYRVRNAPELYRLVARTQENKKNLPKYRWPEETLRVTMFDPLSREGRELKIKPDECKLVNEIDYMRKRGGSYGATYLLSRAAAERAAEKITLTSAEIKMVEELGPVVEW